MIQLLSSSAFLIVNKQLAKQIGLKATVLLADLISKREYFSEQDMDSDWFFNTEENITRDTTLSAHQQREALKILKAQGCIAVERRGLPAKNYFRIFEAQVLQLLNNKSVTNQSTFNKNKEIIIKNNKFLIRRAEFVELVMASTYSEQMKDEFIAYWTEPNKSLTKMRFELEKTYDLGRRLVTWQKRSQQWEKKETKSMKGKLDKQLDEYQKGKELL